MSSYAEKLIERLGHDTGSLDARRGEIVLCTPCASAIEYSAHEVAQRHADQVRAETMGHIAQLQTQVNQLVAVVNQLRRR